MASNNFYLFLNNNNSIKKYSNNDASEFTNDVIPPIVFTEANLWEVSLSSCIIPFEGYKTSYFSNNETFDLFWRVGITEENETKTIQFIAKVNIHSILGKEPEEILIQSVASCYANYFPWIIGNK